MIYDFTKIHPGSIKKDENPYIIILIGIIILILLIMLICK